MWSFPNGVNMEGKDQIKAMLETTTGIWQISSGEDTNYPGDFINLTSVGVLLLKISNSNFRAFDNCCPHSGSKNAYCYTILAF